MKLENLNYIKEYNNFKYLEKPNASNVYALDPALNTYVTDLGIGYAINNALRNSEPLSYSQYQTAKGLDSIFYSDSLTINAPTKVYRGISYTQISKNNDELKVLKDVLEGNSSNSTFVDKGFVSTTTSLEIAKRFAGENGVVLEINLPAGTKYIDVARTFKKSDRYHRFAKQEQEWLLPRSSKFKITEKANADGIVKVEYMGEVYPKEALRNKF